MIDPSVTWAHEAALTLIREAVENDNSVTASRVFEVAAEPEERDTITNVILVMSTLVTHISTLLILAGGGAEGALLLVDQMLDTNSEQARA